MAVQAEVKKGKAIRDIMKKNGLEAISSVMEE
jgi:hypothetical protein